MNNTNILNDQKQTKKTKISKGNNEIFYITHLCITSLLGFLSLSLIILSGVSFILYNSEKIDSFTIIAWIYLVISIFMILILIFLLMTEIFMFTHYLDFIKKHKDNKIYTITKLISISFSIILFIACFLFQSPILVIINQILILGVVAINIYLYLSVNNSKLTKDNNTNKDI